MVLGGRGWKRVGRRRTEKSCVKSTVTGGTGSAVRIGSGLKSILAGRGSRRTVSYDSSRSSGPIVRRRGEVTAAVSG